MTASEENEIRRDSRGEPTSGTLVSQLMLGYMTTQMVSTTLRLELPDRLGEKLRAADELAYETGTDPRSLLRLLRALASVGITDEVEPGSFELTATGRRLRRDVENSLYAMARVFSDPTMTRGWDDLIDSVRTGEPAFGRVFGAAYYEHLEQDAELSKLFHEAHGQSTKRAAESVARAYDFSDIDTIVDVGGGDGTLLSAVLAANPGPRGIVFDTDTGVVDTAATLETAGVADRAEVRTGDFLVDVPAGADLYVLKSTIHNWDDERAVTILECCRRAILPGGRLLLVETVLPTRVDPSAPPFAYFSDMNMLVNLGGQEHTEDEFAELLSSSGFDLVGVRPIPDAANLGLSIIEAVPR